MRCSLTAHVRWLGCYVKCITALPANLAAAVSLIRIDTRHGTPMCAAPRLSEKGISHALDNRGDLDRYVATRNGDLVHHRWLHPHLARDCDHHGARAGDSRATT